MHILKIIYLFIWVHQVLGPQVAQCKEPACQCRRFLGQEGPLEEGMATHSNILAWGIP